MKDYLLSRSFCSVEEFISIDIFVVVNVYMSSCNIYVLILVSVLYLYCIVFVL
jgi:hypothetical protein